MFLHGLFRKTPSPESYLSTDRSEAFRTFIESFFPSGWEQAREGRDEVALKSLSGDERELAEKILIEQIGLGFHSYACHGVAILKSQSSLRRLRKYLREPHAFASALAIFRIATDDSVVPILLRAASVPDHWTSLIHIAIDLRHVPRRAVVDHLVNMMRSPDALVRHHAVDSLFYLHGLRTSWDVFSEQMENAKALGLTQWSPGPAERDQAWIHVMSDDLEEREATVAYVLATIKDRPLRKATE